MHIKNLTLLLCSLFFSVDTYANCYSISDQDKRNFCLAKTKQQSSYCYSIRNNDNKNECLALLKN